MDVPHSGTRFKLVAGEGNGTTLAKQLRIRKLAVAPELITNMSPISAIARRLSERSPFDN